ncbi:hypothetical protein GCM10027580_06530 [Corynebacterium faecale]
MPTQRSPKCPELLKRRFTAEKPNTIYVGDITYLPIADWSNMYLATIIDCYSWLLTGFAIADHMRTELVEEALAIAHGGRGNLDWVIFHSMTAASIPLSNTASCVNGSMAESFSATLKREVLKDWPVFASQLVCRRDVFRWCIQLSTPGACTRGAVLAHQTPSKQPDQLHSLSNLD